MIQLVHAARPVSDLDRAREFYVDGLGMEHRWGFEEDGVEHIYVGDEGVADIHLFYDPENDEPIDAGGNDGINDDTSVCLLVDEDLEGLFEDLGEETNCRVVLAPKEVEFESHRNVICFVEDPDGHLVELIERLEGPPPSATGENADSDAGGTGE